jgi:ribosome maturation factor RimP
LGPPFFLAFFGEISGAAFEVQRRITNDPEQLRTLSEIVAPVCRAHGLLLVDARFHVERGTVLRVLIEREEEARQAQGGGVSLADCQAVSEDLSVALDVDERTAPLGAYRLEVSSPGLDRPLFKLDDYKRFLGREVKIQMGKAVSGRKRFRGTLLDVEGENIRIEQDGAPVVIRYAEIHRANLVFEF